MLEGLGAGYYGETTAIIQTRDQSAKQYSHLCNNFYHITFTDDWRSEMVWTLLPVSGSHNWQIQD